MGPKLTEGKPVEVIEPDELFDLNRSASPALQQYRDELPVDFTPRRNAMITLWGRYTSANQSIEPPQEVVRLINAGVSIKNISDQALADFDGELN